MRRTAPVLGLLFAAPLVAEFLLGNLPVTLLPAVVPLAPMYGGGALLIREIARRRGRGWPTILALGLAFGIVEEGFATQSLFNPNYLRANLHLLDSAYIPALGIGGAWTVYVLTLHAVWSIAVSVALVEALVPARRATPWLGTIGLALTAVLFAAGVAIVAAITLHGDGFMSSPGQFASAAALVVALVALALFRPRAMSAGHAGTVPAPWIVGAVTLTAASLFLVLQLGWAWRAVATALALEATVAAVLWRWSRRDAWSARHVLAAAGGAALAYGWHAFPQPPVIPTPPMLDLAGNVLFLAALLVVLLLGMRRTTAAVSRSEADVAGS